MCGIFAYIGTKNNAANIVLDGLKRLEYRGYDSWGIAAKLKQEARSKNLEEKLVIEKHTGKIGSAHLDSRFIIHDSNLAIGHTRWATHGGVTVANAHPHGYCTKQIAVLHNGIIENYAELKKGLIKREHKFVSETDTEIMAHLIEENLKKSGFATAVRDSFNKLKGMNAMLIMNSASSEIIAVKNGSPLVIGIGKDEIFAASDAAGILKHTNRVLFLEDNYLAILGKDIKLLKLPKGTAVKPKFTTLSWKFEETEKGK